MGREERASDPAPKHRRMSCHVQGCGIHNVYVCACNSIKNACILTERTISSSINMAPLTPPQSSAELPPTPAVADQQMDCFVHFTNLGRSVVMGTHIIDDVMIFGSHVT